MALPPSRFGRALFVACCRTRVLSERVLSDWGGTCATPRSMRNKRPRRGPVQQFWRDQGFRRPGSAPLGPAKKSAKTVLGLNVFFDALPSALWRLRSPKKLSEFPRGGKKAPNTHQSEPTKMSQGGGSSFLGVTSGFSLLSSLFCRSCSLRSHFSSATSNFASAKRKRSQKQIAGAHAGGVAEPPDDWEPQLQCQIAFELRLDQT